MTRLEIFHTVIFIILGIVSLYEAKNARNLINKYINLAIGLLALLISLYDILVTGFKIQIF